MRQAGILAAAGIYALDHHVDRLAEDHVRASSLGERLAELDMFDFDPTKIETNLVYARLSHGAIDSGGDAFVWEKRFVAEGVMCFAESASTVRFVTHLGIDNQMIDEAVRRISKA
jgi:threonine aldolase